MRKALLLSGNIRNLSEVYPYIKGRILDRYQPDVFVSVWTEDQKIKESFHQQTKGIKDSLTVDDVLKIFNPKSFIVQEYSDPNVKKIRDVSSTYSHLGPQTGEFNHISFFMMWYMIKKSLDLMIEYEKKTGFEYSHIFRCRFDVKIHDPLILPPNINELIIPVGYDWRGGINDTFSFGSREPMVYYCSLFDYIEEYLSNGVYFHPETILRYHLEKSVYKITRSRIRTSLRGIKIWEK